MLSSVKQKTIGEKISFSGKALQTGKSVEVVCKPADPDTGIIFSRTDLAGEPSLRLGKQNFENIHKRRSTIKEGKAEVQTVEHLLAALWGLEIDNIIIEINGLEVPALDGSAKEFIDILKNSGIVEQEAKRNYIKIEEPIRVEKKDSSLVAEPNERFEVSYYIDYNCPSIEKEEFKIKLDIDSFKKEIAPARTFCLKTEALFLLKLGFGKGATLENTLVMDKKGPVGTTLRFSNEPVRHKILDLVGDLYLLGVPVVGKFTAKKSGHNLNMEMAKAIYEKYIKNKQVVA